MSVTKWTDEQLGLVARETASTLNYAGITLSDALRSAQNLYIPKTERMSARTCGLYTQHSTRLRKALEDAGVVYPNRATGTKGGLVEVQRRQQKLEPLKDLLPAPATAPVEPKTVKTAEPRLYTADEVRKMLDDLRADMIEVIGREAAREVRRLLGEPEPESVPTPVDTESELAPTGKPKTKFLIVGFEPDKNIEVEKHLMRTPELLESVELRFWKNDGNRKLKIYCEWADHVLFMTRFCSHAMRVVIMKTVNPIHINGSITAAVNTIAAYMKNDIQ